MKKKMLLFLLLIGIVFSYSRVYAEEYKHNGFEFTIEKIHLDVYKSKLDENNEFIGYEGEALKSIEVKDKTVKINFTDSKDDDTPGKQSVTSLTNVDVNIDKEEIKSLLDNESLTVDKDNHYFVKMVIDYKIQSVDKEYNHFYQVQYVDKNNTFSFTEEGGTNSLKLDQLLTLDNAISTTFGVFEYKLVGEDKTVTYSKTYEEKMPVYLDYLFNGIILTTYDAFSEDDATANVKNGQLFLFNSYSNMEDYAKGLFTKYEDLYEIVKDVFAPAVEDEDAPQVVEVPDTALSMNKIIYIIGGVIVLAGTLVIGLAFRKKEN